MPPIHSEPSPTTATPSTPDLPLRAELERRRLALAEEIRNYPTPIAGCDQHFNWLLEQQQRVRAQLQQLDSLVAGAHTREALAAALRAFDPNSVPAGPYPHDTVHSHDDEEG